MAKAVQLDLFEGDLDGDWQKLYIAYSENGNFFEMKPHKITWIELENKTFVPDFKESVYVHVDTTRMQKIHEYMEIKKSWNLEKLKQDNAKYLNENKSLGTDVISKSGYRRETFKVQKNTVVLDEKVGDRYVTNTELIDINDQPVLLISKTDSNGHYRKIAEREIVTATFHSDDMIKRDGLKVIKAISVQNSNRKEYEAFMNKEPYSEQELAYSNGRK